MQQPVDIESGTQIQWGRTHTEVTTCEYFGHRGPHDWYQGQNEQIFLEIDIDNFYINK